MVKCLDNLQTQLLALLRREDGDVFDVPNEAKVVDTIND